jgi:hypothetical protein
MQPTSIALLVKIEESALITDRLQVYLRPVPITEECLLPTLQSSPAPGWWALAANLE